MHLRQLDFGPAVWAEVLELKEFDVGPPVLARSGLVSEAFVEGHD